ncbi:MAG: hypothetical protein KKF48_04825 [Nanoarchaeota archaeon]|nr:hypothetical protein [Nanoarchaeota archaeon]MBU1028341.1 hypothetical protein [Nanoarchaeota archaeon]
MKERGKLVLALLVFILLFQVVSAYTTEIKIKTMPYHEVQITTYKIGFSPSEGKIEVFKNISNQYGDCYFTLLSNEPEFNLILFIKKDGEKVTWTLNPEMFLKNAAGEEIYIERAPSYFEFIETPNNEINITEEPENETIEDEILIEDENSQNSAAITGFVIGNVFSSKIFYFIVGIFALLIIVFITSKITKYKLEKEPKEIKVRKLSEVKAKKQDKIDDLEKTIKESEDKIREVKEEIKKIKETGENKEKSKKQEKIDAVKKRIENYEKELIKLRQENKD